jgi:enoyl-CoA hydratase/carnithine racemase
MTFIPPLPSGVRYQTILVDIDDGVALVTLNRPDELNAMTTLMGRELGHAMTSLDATDEIRAIVVTGAGRAFCAGIALDPDGTSFRDRTDADLGIGPHLADVSTWDMNTPILAAINGPAVGLGLTWPLQWDIRLAADDAKMGFVFTRRGLIPEGNTLWLLSRLVGASTALELLLTGRTFSGAEALQVGLVARALPAAQVLPATMELAHELARTTSPAAVALTKRLFYEQLASSERAMCRETEREAFRWMTTQPDAREGMRSFLEKRAPQWEMSKAIGDRYPSDRGA